MARKTIRSADRAPGLNLDGDRANLAALSLLSAAGFVLNVKSGALSWSDDHLIETLLESPSRRIPRSEEALGSMLSQPDRLRRAKAINGLNYDQSGYALQYPVKTFGGEPIWIQERGMRISGSGTSPELVTGVLNNITDIKREQMATAFAASHDPLTRLWNCERFCEALTYEHAAAQLREEPGYIAVIHIGNLAAINAEKGQAAGDIILVRVADYLKTYTSDPHAAARITGAAFGLLCPGLTEPEAKQYVKNICDWISGHNLGESTDLDLSVSMQALSAVQATAKTQLDLLTSQLEPVDSFFAPVKQSGSAPKNLNKVTADDILAALNDQRLTLAYQPIVDARTRHPNHYECLLRLIGPDQQIQTAGPMIAAAETLGYIHLLDRRALHIGAEVLRAHPELKLAFNVSAGTIQNRFAAESYLGALRAMGDDAGRVTLELTETLALKDPDEAGAFAQKAREFGCRFAIDDFGSGHTTFQNLMTIEADMIKIDGSLIKNLSDMPLKETFVRMMVDFANTFGIEIVAEMVNSDTDADTLQKLGVDYFQGYMFGKPALELTTALNASSGQSQALR